MHKLTASFLLLFVGCIAWSAMPAATPPDDDDDADLPPGVTITDRADYIARRDAFIALLRGYDPNKPFDPTARSKANAMLDQQIAARRQTMAPDAVLALPAWTELGPNPIPNGQTSPANPVSGRIAAIEVDPTDPSKVYVGAAQGGVYRSLDGGATWTPIFDGAQSLAIGALTLDPSTGSLWVGTGESNKSGDSFAGVGLYRIDNVNTTANLVGPINPTRNYNDSGNNPQSSGFFTGNSISRILIAPGNELFVSSTLGFMGVGGNCAFNCGIPPLGLPGLTRLANVNAASAASITATRITVGTGEGCFDNPCTGYLDIADIRFDPRDATGNSLVVWRTGNAAAGQGGVYRSTNAMAGAPAFTQTLTTTANGARGGLVGFDRGDGTTTFYAATGESGAGTICNSGNGALRRSTDGGVTWSAKLPGGGGFCGGQCFYNIAMDIVHGASSATDKILLGGNVGSASCTKMEGTSTDGAATTFANTDAGVHADSHVIKIAPSNTSIVYRGDDGGVWKSIDGGATWASLNNTTMRATQFQSIAVHPTDSNFSIGGTQDNGTEKLTTGPAWVHSDNGDGGYALIDQNATNTTSVTMYHTYFNQANNVIGFARSTDAGSSWPSFLGCNGNVSNNGVACNASAVNFYAPMALGPGTPNTVYFGSDRLMRSTDSGTTNVTVSQAPLISGQAVSTIAISPQDDNYRIVGLGNGALFFTTTGSSTLTILDPTGAGSVIPDFYVARTLFDPTNKNTVYIALNGYTGGTAASQSHVWKVTNLSTTPVITAINSGLPDVPVNGLAVDPGFPNHIYVGTDIGVYLSANGGTSFSPYGTGLPRVAVFDMAVQNTKKVLRIATHGRGMWEIPLFSSEGDLSITKSDAVSTVTSGTSTTYRVRVSNGGVVDASAGAILTDAAAIGLSKTAVICTVATPGKCVTPPSIAQLESGSFALPAVNSGQFYEISVTATVTATSGTVTNTATIIAPVGFFDTNSANDAASDTDSVTQSSDLSITNDDGSTSVNAAGTTTYTVRVTNNGPSSVTAATLTDALATGLSKTGVVCSPTPGQCVTPPTVGQIQSGFALPALANGQFYEVRVSANVTAISGSVTNTATVTSAVDPNTGNNSAGDTDTVTPVVDLGITKTNGVSSVNAGGTTTYTMRVTNNGPSSVTGAVLGDLAAAGLSKTGVTCSAAPGQCVSAPSVAQIEAAGGFALPALTSGQFYEISVTANVTAISGFVTNTATIDAPAGTTDSNLGNNAVTDTDTVTPVADLSITKTDAVSSVNAGGTTTYTVRVTNNGPSSVTGAILTDLAATGLSKTGVICSATPGQCVTAPSVAQIEAGGGFALPALSSGQFYEISVATNVTALSGTVTNTATIAAPIGTTDPTPGNNSAVDTDAVTPVADLSITNSDAVSSVNAGGTTTYKVRVTNNGPSSVTGAILTDAAATGLSKTGVTCSATPGQCVGPPTLAQLEGGAFALPALTSGQFYEISVTVNVTAISGTVTNTATVAAPAGTTDPTSGNNSAGDIDTVTPVADLSIINSNGTTSVPAGGTTSYTVRVTNNGPSSVTGATLIDVAATGLSKTGVTCSATPGQCVSAPSVVQLESGTFALPALTNGQFYEISVAANVTALSGANVSNVATTAVPAGTSDTTPGNNTATDTDTLIVGNLTISPVPLDFGDQVLGTTSADKFVTLGNNGGGTLRISGITVALPPFTRTIAGTCGNTLPINIAASGGCTLSYTYSPPVLVYGPANQSFTVTETGTGTTSFSLKGNGIDRIFADGFEGQ